MGEGFSAVQKIVKNVPAKTPAAFPFRCSRRGTPYNLPGDNIFYEKHKNLHTSDQQYPAENRLNHVHRPNFERAKIAIGDQLPNQNPYRPRAFHLIPHRKKKGVRVHCVQAGILPA